MNTDYLKWIREVYNDASVIYFSNTAAVWLSNKVWRDMYLRGLSPREAAGNIIPY